MKSQLQLFKLQHRSWGEWDWTHIGQELTFAGGRVGVADALEEGLLLVGPFLNTALATHNLVTLTKWLVYLIFEGGGAM